jgi:hypothetical protein
MQMFGIDCVIGVVVLTSLRMDRKRGVHGRRWRKCCYCPESTPFVPSIVFAAVDCWLVSRVLRIA